MFFDGINLKTLVVVTFDSKADRRVLTRACAPMDYGPPSRGKDRSNRYHFWDFEPDGLVQPHPLSLKTAQINSMTPTSESFDPSGFVTWSTRWSYPRNWGTLS